MIFAGAATAGAASNPPKPQRISDAAVKGHLPFSIKLGYGDAPAQCQQYIPTGNTNPYAPFTTTVDMVVGDPINAGSGVNQGCRTPQNETAIAVNPNDPNNLVAGANDYRQCCVVSADGSLRNDGGGIAFVSHNGGVSWTNVQLPGLTHLSGGQGNFKKMDSAGDPAIVFGPNNTVYYANIVFSRTSDADAITVNVSHDGGDTWDAPVALANSGGAQFFNDKVFIGASPTTGDVYVSWTVFKDNNGTSPIVVSSSRDFGKTWGASVLASGPYLYNQGSVPVVGNDGAVYVSFEGAVAADNFNDYNIVAKSTDKGKSWTQQVAARNVDETYPLNAQGRGSLTGLNFRLNSFAALTIDRATGRLYMAWADNSAGTSTLSSSQVFLQSSSDGIVWTAKQRLTSSPEDKTFPWVGAHAGKVIVSYYTREFAGAASGLLDFAYVRSGDNGLTWSPSTKLTEQASDPGIQFAGGGFIGDYTGVAVGTDGVAHPVWTDFRGNPGENAPNQDAVTTRVVL